jgi:acyl-CoA synthetase (AMP-forming)/AMP-acid ligase II
MEDWETYTNGPDQLILESPDICTSIQSGSVKIRGEDLEPKLQEPLLSVPSLLKNIAEQFPDQQVTCGNQTLFKLYRNHGTFYF